MRFRRLHLIVLCLVAGSILAAEDDVKDVDANANMKAKAEELVKGEDGRAARIIALQRFVRDEISETKTQYG